jgi:TorA maturation chaperone TorD
MARKRLACCAATSTPIAVSDEFDRMFVSVGAPRIIPNASRYLAGFLHEAPLVVLRSDLAALGLMRSAGQQETEDHLALLCDTMRVLISGGQFAAQSSVQISEDFFAKHLASWASRCLADIRRESKDGFYACIADLADEFFAIETESFRYDDILVAA